MSTNKECPWELLLRISDAHKVGPEGHAELRRLAATATRLLDVHSVGQENASSNRGSGSRGCGRAESNIHDGVLSSAVKGAQLTQIVPKKTDRAGIITRLQATLAAWVRPKGDNGMFGGEGGHAFSTSPGQVFADCDAVVHDRLDPVDEGTEIVEPIFSGLGGNTFKEQASNSCDSYVSEPRIWGELSGGLLTKEGGFFVPSCAPHNLFDEVVICESTDDVSLDQSGKLAERTKSWWVLEMEADRPPDPITCGSAQMAQGIIGEASDSQCSDSLDVLATNPGHTAARSRSASKSACNGAKGGSIDGFTLRAGRAQRARARCNFADAGSGGTSSAPCMPIAGDGSGGTVDHVPYSGNIANGVAASSSLAAISDTSDSGYSSDGSTVRGLPTSPSQVPTNDSSAVDALVSEAELFVQTHTHGGPVSDLYKVPWTYSFFFSTLDGYFDENAMTSIAHQ